MVQISEFLPNPVGRDADGEWIELFADSDTDLAGWVLKDAGSKTHKISGQIKAGEFLVLDYKTTKISLNNDGETLYLYDSSGRLADEFSGGAAPEGKSVVRTDGGFVFAAPSPGRPNPAPEEAVPPDASGNLTTAPGTLPAGERTVFENFDFLALAIVGSAVFASLIALAAKKIYKDD